MMSRLAISVNMVFPSAKRKHKNYARMINNNHTGDKNPCLSNVWIVEFVQADAPRFPLFVCHWWRSEHYNE